LTSNTSLALSVEGRVALLGAGEHAAEAGDRSAERPADAVVDRGEAEVLADRDAQAAEIDRLQVRGRRIGGRPEQRVAGIGPGHDAMEQRGIGDRPPHGALDAKRRPADQAQLVGNRTGARPEADHAAVGGGVAQGAAHVRAGREGHHAGRQRHG
jgi:hypothetical protein